MRSELAFVGLVLATFAFPTAATAQEFDWAARWGGAEQEIPSGIALDGFGNVYVSGYRVTSTLGDEIFVLKHDDTGVLSWSAQAGAAGQDRAYDVAVDTHGASYVVGRFSFTVDFDPGPGTFLLSDTAGGDPFAWKLDEVGRLVWAKQMPANLGESKAVAIDSAGNLYTTGWFRYTLDADPGPGVHELVSNADMGTFVTTWDSAGEFLWAGQFSGGGGVVASDLVVDASGYVLIAGGFAGTVDFDPGPGTAFLTAADWDAFVVKLSVDTGAFVWARSFGSPSEPTEVRGLAVDSAGNVYTAGDFQSTVDFDPGLGVFELTGIAGEAGFVSKLDGDGEFVWAVKLDHPRGITLEMGDLAVDAHDNLYAGGWFLEMADFDPGPETVDLRGIASQAFLWKLDSAANFMWAGQVEDGTFVDDPFSGTNAVAVDAAGRLFAAGGFFDTQDFDPGFGTRFLTSAGLDDAFVIRLRQTCELSPGQGLPSAILFARRCAQDASELPGSPGEPYGFDLAIKHLHRGPKDRFYLSGSEGRFWRVALGDAVSINDVDSGFGPLPLRQGIPPYRFGAPMDHNLVSAVPYEVTESIPVGTSTVVFAAVDTDRGTYGNTDVYLLRDCSIAVEDREEGGTRIRFISHDVEVDGVTSTIHVVGGDIVELREDGDFSRATCLVPYSYLSWTADSRPNPAEGRGYYYLFSGQCSDPTYGDSFGLTPDPRDALDAGLVCP